MGRFSFGFLIIILSCELHTMRQIEVGPCYLSFYEPCANNSIQFLLFNGETPNDKPIILDNLSPILPIADNKTESKQFKIIIHGYGGHVDVHGFKKIRDGK